MADPTVALFGRHMRLSIGFYLQSFPRSYVSYGGPLENLRDLRLKYQEVVDDRTELILNASHGAINKYLYLYDVRVSSPDQFKIIYFVGWAINNQLELAGLTDLQPVHLFSMIGMLDNELKAQAQIERAPLTNALTKAARRFTLFDELGPLGTYLIYKTMTNAIRDVFGQRPI
jgi:hypothetical protein